MNAKVANPLAIDVTNSHCKSNGTVKLKSANPFDYPLIDPNFLSTDEDIEAVYEGIQLLLKIIQTEKFRSMDIKLAFDMFPGCNHTKPLSKEYWYCYLKRVTGTAYHPVATCLMGQSPQTGVVNNELKVFGVDGLRVADSSAVPFQITGHPNAACNVIGEKVSQMIKKSYNFE